MTKQNNALRLADALAYCDASVASQAAAELRCLHAENTALQAGYSAARLEIESLKAQSADAMHGEHAELRRLSDCCPELNLSNYGPDDVDELNGWAIEVSQCIDHALAAQPAGAQVETAPQQEAQEPSHRETVDVVGVRSNGEHVNLEKIAMPPRMKAREIAIEQFGSFKDDDGSDAEMCFGALEYFLEWLIQQGWSKAPQPAPAAQGCSLDVVLDAFENKTRGIPQAHIAAALVAELRAAIEAARAAQEGK